MVTIHDIKAILEQEVATWESMGNPCILSRFVLRHGKIFPGDKRHRGTRKRPHKECFKNTADAVLFGWDDYEYYEGLAVSKLGWPVHHAWCVDSMNIVQDLTWLHPEECTYMGVHIPRKVLSAQLVRNKVYGIFDTGRGFNVEYMFDKDPELKTIVEEILARPRPTVTL